MYNKFSDTIAEAYKQVELFNEIASNLDNVTIDSLDNQLSFVYEELVETIDALEAGDDEELLDGCADLFVTVAGLMQKLDAAGFKVAEAITRVNENNLSKFNSTGNFQPPNTNAVYNKQYDLYSFLDKETGKIRKPTNFLSVDLEGTYVKGFLKGEI